MTPIVHITDKEQALQRENERLTEALEKAYTCLDKSRNAVRIQDVTIEALKADAERYQWVKTKINMESAYDRYQGNRLWFAVYDTKSKGLDAAIDAAMKEQS